MAESKKIKNALISVFHKDNLEPIVKKLNDEGVNIYSTGGTQKFIEDQGVPVNKVEELTSYPSILGGRVKTLHPKVFGGILARRHESGDKEQLSEFEIPEFDLVIVDLYPFEETVASGASEQDIIEKIDIGGISLIRAAAKNFRDVMIVSSRKQYDEVVDIFSNGAATTLEERKKFAGEAFAISSHYDTAIYDYFAGSDRELKISIPEKKTLRYGENPHQKGEFFGALDELFDQLHGKELSYNNLLDVDAAVNLMAEFNETTFAILKHNNACGIASREKLVDAYKDALAGDPVSAFGGIMITNCELDGETAQELDQIFFEVVIAPSYTDEALEVLKKKKKRIILVQKEQLKTDKLVRTALNGYLVQDKDSKIEESGDLENVTDRKVTDNEVEDLLFANKICKHTKSNTIVLAKNKQLLGSGTGQTSRVDALRHAITKAKAFKFELQGGVMASDAFFPFPDCVEIADGEGIEAVIQPGGSIRDNESIDYCNQHNMAMVTTGVRHFKH
ncbi:bifunctional phosphoribosylaminoimidazolecarboxamide formyltransferase/IMP cyclohydrolase [Salibacter sp.]|uniref:bifunctional phosphoribosylaminoimidazolecarboxamide formyltransferase/IMP cyclohydrolase n=1 Tax=Salibacter sp. TaxID=2010995 RepID=UPI0028704769|nr:bifunctional phosphoribosylaminoimidazolecarboxamide formyltransferase/IMP cyclohydrolase [Salibacter sp.]MDR9399514.1 bifunctional phosphoribosylaminoimidazolecarboxamide formyltransferase/IMP cyclohydrolase [Salibacter sp.]MDR9488474.1 bifunctional phosphoribosylaminoimidazolecarboxamide formyltransferase/IMP cyclohydrolase [Salibacter sp.]